MYKNVYGYNFHNNNLLESNTPYKYLLLLAWGHHIHEFTLIFTRIHKLSRRILFYRETIEVYTVESRRLISRSTGI